MYTEHVQEFAGLAVIDFEGAKSWKGSGNAYRLHDEYEDETSLSEKLDEFLKLPGASDISALVIGIWSGGFEGGASSVVANKLVEIAPRLPKLRAIFFGDITYEETELSWIEQGDMTPILNAYPQLEILRVRGGNSLQFSRTLHSGLRQLIVETGGLRRDTIREIVVCDFPNLEHLELHLGEGGYGFDGGVEDLQPLLSGVKFQKLRYLGLRNSEIADDVAAVAANSPIVRRIEVLDLSLGNLSDQGVRSLKLLPKDGNLKRLDISHHYASEAVLSELVSTFDFEVVADDAQSPDDDWRPISHAE